MSGRFRSLGTPRSPLTAYRFSMPEPGRRERYHISRVLLVAEEQPAFAEGGAPEREGKHFAQLLNQEHFDPVAHFARQILQIRLVLLGQNDRVDPGPNRTQHLLLHPTDREDPAPKRDLTRHGNIVTDQAPREGGYHG